MQINKTNSIYYKALTGRVIEYKYTLPYNHPKNEYFRDNINLIVNGGYVQVTRKEAEYLQSSEYIALKKLKQ